MMNVIETVAAQNLLAPFCCFFEKTLYDAFLCFPTLASSLNLINKKLKTPKKFLLEYNILASLNRMIKRDENKKNI